MKSYISRKLPLETRITDQIAVLRFAVTEAILTGDTARVEASCEISHPQVSMSAYRRVRVLTTSSATISKQEGTMDKSQELQQLTGHVEGLRSKVANDQSPQLQALRSRVTDTIESAKSALAKADSAALDAIKNAANSADDYVRENPWMPSALSPGWRLRWDFWPDIWLRRKNPSWACCDDKRACCDYKRDAITKINRGKIHGYGVADHYSAAAVRRRRRFVLGHGRRMGHRSHRAHRTRPGRCFPIERQAPATLEGLRIFGPRARDQDSEARPNIPND